MSKLISGKEALIALANGEEVEYTNSCTPSWHELSVSGISINEIINPKFNKFRLKPRTITINGVEVPAPFKPKKGDKYFFIDPVNSNVGYSSDYYEDKNEHACQTQFGAWRNEEGIKQVVVAFRQVLGGSK